MTATPTPTPSRSGARHDTAGDVRTYYGRPVLKEPVWTWEIPAYFFTGGAAGAAAVLAVGAEVGGRPGLARSARRVAALGALTAGPLLVSDLGRPGRFHHMLRVAKPTSPMSVGSWTLVAFAPAAIGSALLDQVRRGPRLRRVAAVVAAALGPVMSTYTAVLVANTAIPVWQLARRDLPVLFAASSAASAGSAVLLLTPADDAGPARRLALAGAGVELALGAAMRRRLGPLAVSYEAGRAGRLERLSTGATAVGAAALAGPRGWLRRAGAVAVLAGSLAQRFAVIEAGRDSSRRPEQVVTTQR